MMTHKLPQLLLIAVLSFAPATRLTAGPAPTARPASPLESPPPPESELARSLAPFLDCLNGRSPTFSLSAELEGPIGGDHQRVAARLDRTGDESFRLVIDHQAYGIRIQRDPDRTVLVVPHAKVVFVGEGVPAQTDQLAPAGLLARLISPHMMAFPYLAIIEHAHAPTAAAMLTTLASVEQRADGSWGPADGADLSATFGRDPPSWKMRAGQFTATLTRHERRAPPHVMTAIGADYRVVDVDRKELERLIVRGLRRTLEVLLPSPALSRPDRSARSAEHGELFWIDHQRVVLLHGSPTQIGVAHGRLLADEVRMCVDSTIYMVGLADTLRQGRWFPRAIRDAYTRLAPHIPDDHKRELDALADAAGISHEEARLANVFPELFHCSGFAVFGKATQGGKLYHGRVLDYMTKIGLHHVAAVFVTAPDGKIPFVSAGYAGFTGSVTGMNDRQVSLGEMGGRGEGQWDGVPMATLMRRGLEECATLDEVKALWQRSPRTCEYYYVFADGKIPDAVAVAATPEAVEFIEPGQTHERLGEGIADTVILSGGNRLATLRQRVSAHYGRIDADRAMWLMTRPVAMRSNLHNVLFVPQDRVMYAAHADDQGIAAERPYVRIDLGALLERIRQTTGRLEGVR